MTDRHGFGSSSLAGPRRKAVPSVFASPKRTKISTISPSGYFWEGGGRYSGVMFPGLGDHASESVSLLLAPFRKGRIAGPPRKNEVLSTQRSCTCSNKTVVQNWHTWKLGIPPHDVYLLTEASVIAFEDQSS